MKSLAKAFAKVRARAEAANAAIKARALKCPNTCKAGRECEETGILYLARGERWEAFAWRRGDPGLALALSVARRCTGLTLRSLGEAAGGMDYNAVGMAIKRLEQRVAKEPALRRTLEAVINEMQ